MRFPVKQRIEDGAAGDAVAVLEQDACLLEQALLAGQVKVEKDIGWR
jgi:hypothetical protein